MPLLHMQLHMNATEKGVAHATTREYKTTLKFSNACIVK